MIVFYTVCSLDRMAFAHVLGDSLRRWHPDAHFIIGLVDRIEGDIDRAEIRFPYIEAHTLGIPFFSELTARYNLFELSCALKPFFAEHLFAKHAAAETVAYLDADIVVFSSLDPLLNADPLSPILLTPHSLSPMPDDGLRPQEFAFVLAGIFNAGFLSLRRTAESTAFLAWWSARMRATCHGRTGVDQIWLNLAPIFFATTKISRHPGANVAYWNLHERRISRRGERFWVNESQPLLFFHFSGFNPDFPDIISGHQDRHSFSDKPALRELFDDFHTRLLASNHAGWRAHVPYYKRGAFSRIMDLGATIRSAANEMLQAVLRCFKG